MLFAIEYKYIINSHHTFADEVRKDNIKLSFALQNGAMNAGNLVFCNTSPKYLDSFQQAVLDAHPYVTSIFALCYYEGDVKRTPKPVTNSQNPEIRKLLGASGIAGALALEGIASQ